LPIKLDVIPGTVIEAMLLELPVSTYKTTGTPYLNKDGVTVLLAEMGDINKLAANMNRLLNDSELVKKLKKDAKTFVENEFDNTKSAQRLFANYLEVIEHFRIGKEIDKTKLFSTEEFPVYK
jgi:glycosyltransferase involved in cell wall biosynthesis